LTFASRLPLLVLFFLIGAIFKIPWLTIFSATLIVVIWIAYYWQKHSLDNVHYRRRWHYRRGFPQEHTRVQIEVENKKMMPLSWFHVSDPWPLAIAPEDSTILAPSAIPGQGEMVNIYSLRWFERSIRNYELIFRKRGIYRVGPAEMKSGDLFGIFEKTEIQTSQDFLTVFPELLPPWEIHLRTEDPFGDRRTRRRLFEDPNQPIGVRAYHPKDEFRRIHWPATARTGSLQVKVYQPVSFQILVICLNVSTTEQPWLGTSQDLLEQLIKVSATLVQQSLQAGYSVGLISNGYLAHADHPFHIAPGRSRGQLALLLETLAAVTAYTSAPFDSYLAKSLTKLPYGATLVVLTGILTPGLCESLTRLKKYRHNITLISLDKITPPPLPGIQTIHIPFQPEVTIENRK